MSKNAFYQAFGTICIVALLGISICGCDRRALLADDLEMAKEALLEGNMPLCERLAERFLREERDPEKRWEAWNLLIKAINHNSPQPRATLECLDVMLVEYEENESREAEILPLIGKYNFDLRHYDTAVKAWSVYIDLGGLTETQRINGYRQLAASQFGLRHFAAGEETLNQCLGLPAPEHEKIYCMLDLADVNIAQEKWQDVADLCQQILDAEPDENALGMAGYLRGDALEQLGNYKSAIEQFLEAKKTYPNPAVIENRIAHLQLILKNKKESK
ncbi:MAG: tetratricopeptide repeat protein [Desulfovibrio sp.]|nr:tetratricopeptide repeat protein [Desulfovibrio sp.]